ncbi:MAG: hypothetical protein Q9160_000074 [Pyrenula sp. 1 TL-2023]
MGNDLIDGNGEETAQRTYAESLDKSDPLQHLRGEFQIPTKADLKRKTLAKADGEPSEEANYLCGNSLGLQPRRTRDLVNSFLSAWATKNVYGHFVDHEDSSLPPFLHADDAAAKLMAPIVGAREEEVAVMGTLTANLQLLMSAFYKPTKEKFKIILESRAFPSDHYAIESQIQYNGFDPAEAMICIEPDAQSSQISTSKILDTISQHASSTALVLLPGIQYYTGQYFDIPTITAHAHAHSLPIGWDCAHAAGNVDLQLHAWDVDFAAWCTYKYLNAGPGAIGAIFVNRRHGLVDMDAASPADRFRPRLSGWWGADKTTRFRMDNNFHPRPGAAGYQVSNPSALDLTALIASLQVFSQTSIADLRAKSLKLTAYLERLLLAPSPVSMRYHIITPQDPAARGAQLSVKIDSDLLDPVMKYLEREGVVVDERKPDVIRVAPAPSYNTFVDCWDFVQVFRRAIQEGLSGRGKDGAKA